MMRPGKLVIAGLVALSVGAHAAGPANPLPPAVISAPLISPPDDHRIVLWKEPLGIDLGVAHSQSLIGGDAACLRFTGRVATLHQADQAAVCLGGDGQFLFSVACTAPQPDLKWPNGTLIHPGRDAVCTRS
jgi:hypothetical protein